MNDVDWNDRPTLVTGAAGFIGSHLVEALAVAGAKVRAFVRYNSRNDYGWLEQLDPTLLESVEIFRGDLANPEAADSAVQGCDSVFHLGALIPIPYSYVHPREFVTANIKGTLNVLEACRRHDVRRLVHTSTSEVYGTAQNVPIDEKHPFQAQSPVRRDQDRRRQACVELPALVRHAGRHRPSVQHLRAAAIRPCRHPDADHAGADQRRGRARLDAVPHATFSTSATRSAE